MNDDIFDISLADFYMGHDSDPLKVPTEFVEWKEESQRYQALFERCLTKSTGAHTSITDGNKTYDVVNMASLDYLGLCRNEKLLEAQREALLVWGNGAGGVPLLSGMSTIHRTLEEKISNLTGQDSALLFSSGFSAAIGLSAALLRKSDVAVCDERAHISWMDGIRMSGASLKTFSHNDPEDLSKVLHQFRDRRRVVIVDGVYSMDGDFANLPAILEVTEQHGVGVVVDEAHSIFAAGENGGGIVEHFGVADRVKAVMGTFSKALGFVGGFVAAEKNLIDYIRYYGHSYAFSSAIPPATVAGIVEGVDLSVKGKELREKLWGNARYFRSGLHSIGIDTGLSQSWVVPIILGNNRKLLYDSVATLMEEGLYVAPVDYPAVSEDQVRIRAAVSAAHTTKDIDFALSLIKKIIVPFL